MLTVNEGIQKPRPSRNQKGAQQLTNHENQTKNVASSKQAIGFMITWWALE
jgi:hypothetical protein